MRRGNEGSWNVTLKTQSGKPLSAIFKTPAEIERNIKQSVLEAAKLLFKEIIENIEQKIRKRTGKYHASWTDATKDFQSEPGAGANSKHVIKKPAEKGVAIVGTLWPGAHFFEYGTRRGIKRLRIIAKAISKRKKEAVEKYKNICWGK